MDEKKLMELAGKLEKEELLQLVGRMAQASGSARKVMEEYCGKNAVTGGGENLEAQLLQHWGEAQPVIAMFNTCGGGSSSDEDSIREELDAMKTLLGKGEFSWDVRKEILDGVLEEVASDNSGLTDVLVDMALRLCKEKEERIYVADFLSDYGNPFYKNYASELYMENNKGRKEPEEAKENPVNSADYMALANRYKKQGDAELALKTVLEGLEKAQGRLYEIYEYLFSHYAKRKDESGLEDLYKKASARKQDKDFITELLYGYYKEQKNYGKKKEMLLDLISCADCKKLGKWYAVCRQELSGEDFAAEEGKTLQAIKEREPAIYVDLCLENGKTKEVLEYLAGTERFTQGNADAEHRISKQLAAAHPKEIVEAYWAEARYLGQLGGEEDCAHAVDVLREIQGIMERNHWTDEWNERYNDFIRESITNPMMISELARF